MIVNKKTLAEFLGVTEETLTQWQNQGMPILLKRLGRSGSQYDTKAVIDWMEATRNSDSPPTDYNTERTRKVKLEADILSLEKAQLQGRLIPAEKAEQAWSTMAAAFRAKMLSIPSRCAIQIIGLSVIESEKILRDLINEALAELSESDLADRITESFEYSAENSTATSDIDS